MQTRSELERCGARVYLNGVEQSGVVEANAVEGWVVLRAWNGTQRTVYGAVRIELGDETGG